MAEMTLTRILSRVSTLKKSIGKEIQELEPVAVTKGHGESRIVVNSSMSVKDTEDRIQSQFQSIIDKINERLRLRRLLTLTNSTVKVKINGMEMTIAEAIEYKNSLEHDRILLTNLRQMKMRAEMVISNSNTQLDTEIERAVQVAYGNEKGKVTEDQYSAIAAPRIAKHGASLLDPIGIQKQIDDLDRKISSFMEEVDFALSEINARTSIDV
jgi:hypothetical protein